MTKVLIVDNNSSTRERLSELLKLEGYQVSVAGNGQAALEKLCPDVALVLTDLHMPGLDSMGVLHHVLEHQPDTAVIVFSGNGNVNGAVNAMRLGAYDYFLEPLNTEDVLIRIDRALERRQLLLEQRQREHSLERQLAEQREALTLALGELQYTYQSTLEALASALDLRDKETEGHSRRVTEYATALARKLEIQGEQLETMRHGALLHDVGKIGIPDSILHKPAALNKEEWTQMREHPEIGFSVLKDIEFLHEAVTTIVLHHHERFDGSGYPGGLMYQEIPLGARIFAVADALDALTSDRTYRPARSYSAARAEIQRHSDRQFDPQVVKAFMAIPDRDWQAISTSVAILYS